MSYVENYRRGVNKDWAAWDADHRGNALDDVADTHEKKAKMVAGHDMISAIKHKGAARMAREAAMKVRNPDASDGEKAFAVKQAREASYQADTEAPVNLVKGAPMGFDDNWDAQRRYEVWKAKYTQEQINAMGAKGQAFKNANGEYSYPIGDSSDLQNAKMAIGRAIPADRTALIAYINRRAKALGQPPVGG